MNLTHRNATWVIVTSFLLGLVLAILPLPNWANWLRPEWVLLILICWNLVLPIRVSVGAAWLCGLLMDILGNFTLGEHALIFTIVSYFVIKFGTRIIFFPFWQKSIIILGLLSLAQFLQIWLEGMMGNHINSYWYWLSVPVTTLLWPWVMALVQKWQEKYNVN